MNWPVMGLFFMGLCVLVLAYTVRKHPPSYTYLVSDRYGFIDGSAD